MEVHRLMDVISESPSTNRMVIRTGFRQIICADIS